MASYTLECLSVPAEKAGRTFHGHTRHDYGGLAIKLRGSRALGNRRKAAMLREHQECSTEQTVR